MTEGKALVHRPLWNYHLANAKLLISQAHLQWIKDMNAKAQEPPEPPFMAEQSAKRLQPINTCKVCNKPLGQDSKDADYPVCHEHRLCTVCSKDVSATEASFCISLNNPVSHARCIPYANAKSLEQKLDLLNLRRLLTSYVNDLTKMSFDEKYQFLKMMQETATEVSIHIRTSQADPLKKKLASDKEALEKLQSDAEKNTSSRPTGKSPTADDEKAISWFMQTYGIKERKVAQAEMKKRDKAISDLQTIAFMDAKDAIETVHQQFLKKFNVQGDPTVPSLDAKKPTVKPTVQ